MKVSYYPGCTLKTKARNLDDTVVASLQALGVAYEELERWNCCGAAYSLADDNLLSQVAPIRNLIRAREVEADTLVTACSMCYNSLARANELMRADEEKRETINRFMDEEPDYAGEVEVLHILNFLQQRVGWDELRARLVKPLDGLKVACYYGCLLMRPREIAIDSRSYPQIFEEFIRALGATPLAFSAAHDCCGAYQVVSNEELATATCSRIVASANAQKADLMVTSCPLCEFNLGARQPKIIEKNPEMTLLPTFYFTQLLAVALGVDPELCHFELNMSGAREFFLERDLVKA